MPTEDTESVALGLDERDPLRALRSKFACPTMGAMASVGGAATASAGSRSDIDKPCTYLCGNSLGLMPAAAREAVAAELDAWATLGVEGHFHGPHPWFPYHEPFRELIAPLVGAKPSEVVAMNSLTVNLHLLMMSFYRPTKERFKIVIEDAAFPSDQYAVRSQAAVKGFHPNESLIRLKPREGEETLRTEDIVETLRVNGPTIALVMLGAVNYLTGQWFDMDAITKAGREAGAVVGWDLAHAIGNVPMRLHEAGGVVTAGLGGAGADFAVWCSYKYLNAGPGAVGGAFIHERHHARRDVAQLAGWWGHDPRTRFKMDPGFQPSLNADRWALSNPPVLSLAPLRSSLELFREAGGVARLREKSLALTGYLEQLLDGLNARIGPDASGKPPVQIITPRDPARRGCQLSLRIRGGGKARQAALRTAGIVCDFREPNVMRVAPTPLYNSFHDVWRFAHELEASFAAESWGA
ncbi:MAG: kynureninase [Phycisphaerales bacterium]